MDTMVGEGEGMDAMDGEEEGMDQREEGMDVMDTEEQGWMWRMERRTGRAGKQQLCAIGGGPSAEGGQPDSSCCSANSWQTAQLQQSEHQRINLEHTVFLQASVCWGSACSAHPSLGGRPTAAQERSFPIRATNRSRAVEMVQEESVTSGDAAGRPARRCAHTQMVALQCAAQLPGCSEVPPWDAGFAHTGRKALLHSATAARRAELQRFLLVLHRAELCRHSQREAAHQAAAPCRHSVGHAGCISCTRPCKKGTNPAADRCRPCCHCTHTQRTPTRGQW